MTSTAVVITGGTRGIGLGLAREFLALGCRVAVCGRSRGSVDKALAELDGGIATGDIATGNGTTGNGTTGDDTTGDGVRVVGQVCDVTDREQVQALWDAAAKAFGRIDHWINNAGVSTTRSPLGDLPTGQLAAVVGTNLLGVLHGSAVATSGMVAQGGGTVWNMEGLGSDGRAVPGLAAYGATKRAVTYLTDALAKELKGGPVAAAHLSPGIVVTDLLVQDYSPEELAKARKVFNILGDRVETVTPWLAGKVLAGVGNGGRVAWLTRRKAAVRFATAGFNKRDLFGAP